MIETAVQKAIALQFGLGDASVNLDAPLSEYDADSLDLVELVMTIEDELDIEIPDDEFGDITLGTKLAGLTGRKLVEIATKFKG
ncbi:acyl carrier protein [Paraburkholderia dipogonis]|uniref:acyl carrier protein n=1 Tax=Paraburkholderia dipogonis TaxID=1211383 RepID=UPI0038B70034